MGWTTEKESIKDIDSFQNEKEFFKRLKQSQHINLSSLTYV